MEEKIYLAINDQEVIARMYADDNGIVIFAYTNKINLEDKIKIYHNGDIINNEESKKFIDLLLNNLYKA